MTVHASYRGMDQAQSLGVYYLRNTRLHFAAFKLRLLNHSIRIFVRLTLMRRNPIPTMYRLLQNVLRGKKRSLDGQTKNALNVGEC